MTGRRPAPRWLLVAAPRNSESSSPLSQLDWSTWWTDGGPGYAFLKAVRRSDDTVHRVRCRRAGNPRLGRRGGRLYWLVDSEARA